MNKSSTGSINNRRRICSLNYFFPSIPLDMRCKMELDEVASYSITKEDVAAQMCELIIMKINALKMVPSQVTLLDGMACVGGNTISFNKYFPNVVAVELNEGRCRMLKHNIHDVLCLLNVNIYNQCILKFANSDDNKFDVLFLDPEWGGKSYINQTKLKLTISNVPLEVFCESIFKKHDELKIIALKLPLNYNFDEIKNNFSNQKFTYEQHSLFKISFVLLTVIS